MRVCICVRVCNCFADSARCAARELHWRRGKLWPVCTRGPIGVCVSEISLSLSLSIYWPPPSASSNNNDDNNNTNSSSSRTNNNDNYEATTHTRTDTHRMGQLLVYCTTARCEMPPTNRRVRRMRRKLLRGGMRRADKIGALLHHACVQQTNLEPKFTQHNIQRV